MKKIALKQQFDHDTTLTLGTLAAATAISVASKIDTQREMGFRVVKSRIFWEWDGKVLFEGPILFGISIGLDPAGVKAAIEADPQNSIADDSRGEGTYIRFLGHWGTAELENPVAGGGHMEAEVSYGINGWSVPEGIALAYWAYNKGGSALTAGAPIIHISAEHFGVWLRD